MNNDIIIDPQDFKYMMFDVVNVKQKTLFKTYPALYEIVKPYETQKDLLGFDIEKVMAYICLMYDQKSPLRTKISIWGRRKIEAIKYAGFPITIAENLSRPGSVSEETIPEDDQEFEDDEDEDFDDKPKRKKNKGKIKDTLEAKTRMMLTNRIPVVNRLIVDFLRVFRNHEYSYLMGMETVFNNALEKMMQGSADTKEVEMVGKYKTTIQEAYNNLYGETSGALVEETLISIDEQKLNLRPEDIASAISERKYISFLKDF